MDKIKIETLATRFRAALEEFAKEPEAFWKTIYNSFPGGCCNDASMLLAAYLADNGLPGAVRFHGEYGGRSGELLSHVWLNLDGLIIDITADQFEEYGLAPVLLLESSQFHESFEVEEELEVADFRVRYTNDQRWLGYLELMYEKTLSYLSP